MAKSRPGAAAVDRWTDGSGTGDASITSMSIYQLEHDGDVDELRQLLGESDSPAVRGRAAEALGEVADGGDDVVDVLVETAVDDPEAGVRTAAIDALDTVGVEAIGRLFVRLGSVDVEEGEPLPAEVLDEGLAHDAPELRMAAASVIAHEEVEAALPALLDRVGDPDPRVRLRVVRALGDIGDPSAVGSLAPLVEADGRALRRELAAALGRIGGERALETLDPLLSDPELPVRREAVVALGNFERCRPVGRLVEQLEDDEAEIRQAAALATVDLLSNAPAADSHELRSEVVEALATTHGGAVIEALVELFEESTRASRRRNAAWLLGRTADQESVAVEALVAALDDEDESVRRFAATSLVAMDADGVEETLLEALETTYGEGRKMILFVLGKVGSERARRRLLELLDEVEDAEVQERTLAALSRLGGT